MIKTDGKPTIAWANPAPTTPSTKSASKAAYYASMKELYDAVKTDTISDDDFAAMAKAVEARKRAAEREKVAA